MKTAKILLSVCLCLAIKCPLFITNLVTSTPVLAQGSQSNDVERLNDEAVSLYQTGKYREAIAKIDVALTIANTNKDLSGQIICFNNYGLIYTSLGEYQKAIGYYQKSLKISRTIQSRSEEGIALNGLGDVSSKLGQYQKAIEYYQQALIIARENNIRIGESTILNNLGTAFNKLGQYQQAIEYFQKSLVIAKEISSRNLEGAILNGLGTVFYEIGQYQKAIESFQQSLLIRREIGNRSGESLALNNLGSIYDTLGEYQKAIKYYQQSLVIKREIGDRNGEAITLNNIGVSYEQLIEHQKAIEYFEQALIINREVGDLDGEGITLGNLGSANQSLSNYQIAVNFFKQALAIHKKTGNRNQEANSFNSFGSVLEDLKEYPVALESFQKSIDIYKEIRSREGIAVGRNNRGSVFYKLGRLTQAESELRQAIEIWESLSIGLNDKDKISFTNKIAVSYQLLQKVLLDQNKPQAALEVAERGRARALAELLASKIRTTNSATSQKLKQAPNLSRIQQIARAQNATLVEYSTIDDRVLIWVIKPTGQITFHQSKLPPKTTLKDLVVATRDSIKASRGRRSKDDRSKTTGGDLKQLHKLLIAPIAQDLPKRSEERVIILPQNELFLVPFAALQDSQGQYLVQQHTLTIAPSIQVLSLTERKSSKSNISALVVGNPIMPSYNGEELANLPGAEAEASAVSKILQVEPLIGIQAEKQKVIKLMQRAPIIHLATHGLMDTIKGDIPGAIALTNGFLTSGEIFDMELSADLVVLSACNTGRGGTDVDVTGEGVVGLSRSLSVAGVPSVLVSLWEVDDAATKALMEEFYHNLRDKKLTKAQALRQAMLTTMKSYPDPNLWAAFMLVGEGR